jgi:hypothetical protein
MLHNELRSWRRAWHAVRPAVVRSPLPLARLRWRSGSGGTPPHKRISDLIGCWGARGPPGGIRPGTRALSRCFGTSAKRSKQQVDLRHNTKLDRCWRIGPALSHQAPACQDHWDLVDMPKRTTHSDHYKICTFLLRLKSRLAAATNRIFAAPDTRARRHGWQVTVTHGGFGRRYRDPRFDYLAPCPTCKGRGCRPSRTTCSACHGTGRMVLDPAAVSQLGRGQP